MATREGIYVGGKDIVERYVGDKLVWSKWVYVGWFQYLYPPTESGDYLVFDITAKLLAKSEFVTKLQAVCMKCGKPATKSQKIVDGKPASFDSEIIQIGEKETYEPRCRSCHEIGKKKK